MRKFACLSRRFALAVVLGGLFAGAAQAQSYRAHFTLAHETRWGATVLPAGDYVLSMNGLSEPLRVIDASGRNRVLVSGSADYPTNGQPTSLLVTRDGAQRTVRSFNCPDLGHKFVYLPFTRAERDLVADGDGVETVAVRMASR